MVGYGGVLLHLCITYSHGHGLSLHARLFGASFELIFCYSLFDITYLDALAANLIVTPAATRNLIVRIQRMKMSPAMIPPIMRASCLLSTIRPKQRA